MSLGGFGILNKLQEEGDDTDENEYQDFLAKSYRDMLNSKFNNYIVHRMSPESKEWLSERESKAVEQANKIITERMRQTLQSFGKGGL